MDLDLLVSHTQLYVLLEYKASNSKDLSKACCINQVLQKLRNVKVDTCGAEGEDDDDLARDLSVSSAVHVAGLPAKASAMLLRLVWYTSAKSDGYPQILS